jgi:hypothetical protein
MLRQPDRKELDRKDADRRPPPQRALFPNRPGPEAPIPPPNSVDEPPFDSDYDVRADAGSRADAGTRGDAARADTGNRADQRPPERKAGPAWLRRAIAEIESVPRPAQLPAEGAAHAPVEPREARRYDEPQPGRRHPPAEASSGWPAPNAGERAPMQEGWVRPRGPAAPAPAAVAEPLEDFAPEPDLPPPRQAVAPVPNIFDMVWTNDRRRPSSESTPPPEQRHEAPTHPPIRPVEPRPTQSIRAPAAQSIPAAAMQPIPAPAAQSIPVPAPPVRAEPRHELRPEPHPEPRPEPRPLSILKSGVIDEMAYTLFTDGSIEAQMPDGTMRFSSIEELRRHLDQHE